MPQYRSELLTRTRSDRFADDYEADHGDDNDGHDDGDGHGHCRGDGAVVSTRWHSDRDVFLCVGCRGSRNPRCEYWTTVLAVFVSLIGRYF